MRQPKYQVGEIMNHILYGIDMGSPSKEGGFYCWKSAGISRDNIIDISKNTSSQKKWKNAIDDILKEFESGNQIYIAIEAPLIGQAFGEIWKPRFTIALKEGKEAMEHPYYISASGATAFMAQSFLSEIIVRVEELQNEKGLIFTKKINLYECYTSGLVLQGQVIRKPDPEEGKSTHKKDSEECLLMLIAELSNRSASTNIPNFTSSDALCGLGVLSTSLGKKHFMVSSNILVTSREFKVA